jgi:excisionase family DNA binding protein
MNTLHRMKRRIESPQSEILTVEEVATYLKVTERSIYSLLARQEIPAFKVGGSWRFRVDEIEAWTRRSRPSNLKTQNKSR